MKEKQVLVAIEVGFHLIITTAFQGWKEDYNKRKNKRGVRWVVVSSIKNDKLEINLRTRVECDSEWLMAHALVIRKSSHIDIWYQSGEWMGNEMMEEFDVQIKRVSSDSESLLAEDVTLYWMQLALPQKYVQRCVNTGERKHWE